MRNATLNKEAFAVARHVAAGMLSEQEAVSALTIAALHAGLDKSEIRDTITSGFRAGYTSPWEARS